MEVGPEIGYADHHIIVCIPGHAYQWSPEDYLKEFPDQNTKWTIIKVSVDNKKRKSEFSHVKMPLKALNFQISSEKYECHRGLDLKSSFSLVF